LLWEQSLWRCYLRRPQIFGTGDYRHVAQRRDMRWSTRVVNNVPVVMQCPAIQFSR